MNIKQETENIISQAVENIQSEIFSLELKDKLAKEKLAKEKLELSQHIKIEIEIVKSCLDAVFNQINNSIVIKLSIYKIMSDDDDNYYNEYLDESVINNYDVNTIYRLDISQIDEFLEFYITGNVKNINSIRWTCNPKNKNEFTASSPKNLFLTLIQDSEYIKQVSKYLFDLRVNK